MRQDEEKLRVIKQIYLRVPLELCTDIITKLMDKKHIEFAEVEVIDNEGKDMNYDTQRS